MRPEFVEQQVLEKNSDQAVYSHTQNLNDIVATGTSANGAGSAASSS